jgi:hypothetical protein
MAGRKHTRLEGERTHPPRQAFLRAGCLDSDPIRPAGIEESPGAIGSSCGAIGV